MIWAESRDGRFFLKGDGRVHIKNEHTGREAKVFLLLPDGSLNEDGFAKIDEVFGFTTEGRGEHISPRLIFMLDYFSDLTAPGKVINLVSGYRSPEYNSALRSRGGVVAKTSTHIDGVALDFNIEGVDGKGLWELIRSKDCCGAGYYGGATVHLDAGRPRFWEETTSKVRTGESDYNRRIYLSTDYDRYKRGDRVRLSFCSVSDFGFGVKNPAAVVHSHDTSTTVAAVRINEPDNVDCYAIGDRHASRFIYGIIPASLPNGRYKIKIEFCRRPLELMPLETLSNEIEVYDPAP